MNIDDRIYVDDENVEITIKVNADVTLDTATVYSMKVLKNGVEVEWASTVYEEKYLRYVTGAGDLDVAGEYYVQGYFEFPDGGFKGLCRTINFTVHPKWR